MSQIVEALGMRGHSIHVLTSFPSYDGRTSRRDLAPAFESTNWGDITRSDPVAFGGRLSARALGWAGSAWTAHRSSYDVDRADAVMVISPPPSLWIPAVRASQRWRARLVLGVQDLYPQALLALGRKGAAAARAISPLERWAYGRADAVVAVSELSRSTVEARLGRLEARAKSVHIPNCNPYPHVVPADSDTTFRKQLGIDVDTPVLLYAGNLGYLQDLSPVVRAAEEVDGMFTLIVGRGSCYEQVERRLRQLPNAEIMPKVKNHDLIDILATGDIHAVTLRQGFGAVSTPSKLLTTLSAGRPFVASIDVGTQAFEIADESGAGMATNADDPASFVGAVRRLVESADERRRMGLRAVEFARSLPTVDSIAERYERVLFG